jgi:hypothetical protein
VVVPVGGEGVRGMILGDSSKIGKLPLLLGGLGDNEDGVLGGVSQGVLFAGVRIAFKSGSARGTFSYGLENLPFASLVCLGLGASVLVVSGSNRALNHQMG